MSLGVAQLSSKLSPLLGSRASVTAGCCVDKGALVKSMLNGHIRIVLWYTQVTLLDVGMLTEFGNLKRNAHLKGTPRSRPNIDKA